MALGLLMPGDPPQQLIAELHVGRNTGQDRVKHVLRFFGHPDLHASGIALPGTARRSSSP